MKKYPLKTIIFLVLIVFSLSLGVTVGSLIYPYKILSGGILGMSTLILLYYFFVPLKTPSTTTGLQVEFPRDIKFIPLSFFVTLAGSCAIDYVLEFVSYMYAFLSKIS